MWGGGGTFEGDAGGGVGACATRFVLLLVVLCLEDSHGPYLTTSPIVVIKNTRR